MANFRARLRELLLDPVVETAVEMSEKATPAGRATVDFDPESPALAADPDGMLRNLREECPVAWTDAHGGFWVVSDYDDVARVFHDDVTFSARHDHYFDETSPFKGIAIPETKFGIAYSIIETDPPSFQAIRRLMNPFFGPAATAGFIPTIKRVVAEAVDDFIETGHIDISRDLGERASATMTMYLVGLRPENWKRFAVAVHDRFSGDAEKLTAEQERERLGEEIREMIPALRERPADHLLSALANAQVDGAYLSDDVIIGNTQLVIAGGISNTAATIAHAALYLHRNPEARRMMIEQPEKRQVACEEFIRYYSAAPFMARTVTRPVTVGGQQMAAGDRVYLSLGSANTDPEAFIDPDQIQLDRYPNRHLAFGVGIHRCIGSSLARQEVLLALDEILNRMPDYVILENELVPNRSIAGSRGYLAMPASFTPGPRVTPGV